MVEKEEVMNDINNLASFLALRDIDKLNRESLFDKYKINEVDVLVLLGNSITYTIKKAVEAYEGGMCKKILICGGIGHSTDILRSNVKKHTIYNNIKVEGRAEADIINGILEKYYSISKDDIIIENKSTNCGDNAEKALETLEILGGKYKSLILIQDPTMQLRTYLSFLKYIKNKKDVQVINYAPFIPVVNKNIELINEGIDGLWDIDRYLELIIGEIPRLRDDENGYGPKGRNFIEHIDIPIEIEECYSKLIKALDIKAR